MEEEKIIVTVVNYMGNRRGNLMLRYLDPTTGKYVSKSSGTRDKKAAERAAGVWQDELRTGRFKAPSKVTWEEFREKYESEVTSGLAPKTKKKISGIFDAIEKHINPTRVRDITSDRLSQYIKKQREGGLVDATLAGHLAHLQAALGYAVDWGYLPQIPKLPKQQRVRRTKMMKGRPITTEEYERMLASVEAVVGAEPSPSWKRLLEGLWHSGLRLGEAIALYWNRDECPSGKCLEVDLSGKRPMLAIPAELDKGNQERILPIAPEFADFLLATPADDRHGAVFQLKRRRQRYEGEMRLEHVSDTICKIGEKANVKVNSDSGKMASAHDLRRAFGQRWAARVMPQILMQLMRHEDITTTMKYYVGKEAQATADVLYAAIEKPAEPTKDKAKPKARKSRKKVSL